MINSFGNEPLVARRSRTVNPLQQHIDTIMELFLTLDFTACVMYFVHHTICNSYAYMTYSVRQKLENTHQSQDVIHTPYSMV